jgi:hypothetical protein
MRQRRENSASTTHSLSPNKKEAWRDIRKEWESVGLTIDMFQKNRHYITHTLRTFLQRTEIQDIEEALDGGADELSEDDYHMDDFPNPPSNGIPVDQYHWINSEPPPPTRRANIYRWGLPVVQEEDTSPTGYRDFEDSPGGRNHRNSTYSSAENRPVQGYAAPDRVDPVANPWIIVTEHWAVEPSLRKFPSRINPLYRSNE